jgi:GAF domain-containing protein
MAVYKEIASYDSVVREVSECVRLMEAWAEIAPHNWKTRAVIARVFWSLITARHTPQSIGSKFRIEEKEAMGLLRDLEEAIDLSEEKGQQYVAAIGLQVAASIFESCGLKRSKNLYAANAHDLLVRWGSQRSFNSDKSSVNSIDMSSLSLIDPFKYSLDNIALVSASQLLTTSQSKESLFANFFKFLMSSAGATQVVLALIPPAAQSSMMSPTRVDGNSVSCDVTVVASSNSTDESVNYSSRRVDECMPASIANFVLGSGKAIWVANVMDSHFKNDPFLVSHATKSVFCFPIVHKGNKRGLVYLCNDSIVAAFEESRATLVKVMTMQLILSLDNIDAFEILKKKNLELLSLDKMKDDFLARVSHELRTPLNGIIGIACDGITNSRSRVELEEDFRTIENCGNHLLSIINDVLDFSKLRHNQMELCFEVGNFFS